MQFARPSSETLNPSKKRHSTSPRSPKTGTLSHPDFFIAMMELMEGSPLPVEVKQAALIPTQEHDQAVLAGEAEGVGEE